jgi:Protein of unknown function (DUF2911)
MKLRPFASLACSLLLATACFAQNTEPGTKPEAQASPDATASVMLDGKAINIKYSAPSARGRKVMGELVPYDQPWRTGANPATTIVTAANLKIGTLTLPVGTYTLFTLPSANSPWLLIVSKKTGEWGIPYPAGFDFGRTEMQGKTLPALQEVMSISFENTHGKSTELHVRWENTDEFVPVMAE